MPYPRATSRRHFLEHCLVGAGVALSRRARAAGSPAEKGTSGHPNILFVLTDNQSWCHCGIMGDRTARTPAFDRVARDGVLFRQAYAASPSCTPSRSAILTGQDMWRLEEAGLLHGGFPAKFRVYTDLLRGTGYHVGYTGKGWGPGPWDKHGRDSDPVGKLYRTSKIDGAPTGIACEDYAASFMAFLKERAAGQPFCFWFGAREPHRPYPEGLGRKQGLKPEDAVLPAFLPDTEVIRSDYLDYYVEIAWLDEHLGRMLDHLQSLGELDNTLVIVTSDNGIQMPRGITTLYDYGVRVPLAVCWGNRVRGGRETDAFVNLTDLAPTFLEAAGIDIPGEMTGRSLIPLLAEDKGEAERDCVFTGIERHTVCRPGELPYPSRAIRSRDYLYIRNYEPDRWPAGAPDYPAPAQGFYGDVDRSPTKSWMIEHAKDPNVQDAFQLCFGKRPAEELYHVPTDPDQVRNVALDPAHQSARHAHAERLQAYLERTNDPRIDGKSPWDDYPYYSMELRGFRDRITNPNVLPK